MGTPRLLIAAPKSGSGKTLLTCGLLELFREKGHKITAFKCGPDYIDPMFHQKILNVPSENLDSYLAGKKGVKELYEQAGSGSDLVVIEGVMGLYDGVGGTTEEASSYEVAVLTKTPILLVVDAKGMGRTLVPVLAGLLSYDRAHLIRGVILNNTTAMFAQMMRELILKELSLPVLGYVPRIPEGEIKSRHLGLIGPDEIPGMQHQVKKVAAVLEETLDVEQILALAQSCCMESEEEGLKKENKGADLSSSEKKSTAVASGKVKIAVARDEAFCFYYQDNFRMLQEAGAELVFFSPLRDRSLPKGSCGVIFGGGYPENYARELSQNHSMREAVRNAIEEGMPSLAECGGFLYLAEELEGADGIPHPMCGLVKGRGTYQNHLVRFGYVEVTAEADTFIRTTGSIRAHEFHYYDMTDNGDNCLAVKPVSGRSYRCVHAGKRYWWGFPHLYFRSAPGFAQQFVKEAEIYGGEAGYGRRA